MNRDALFQLIKKVITGSASPKEEEDLNMEFFDPFNSDSWDQCEMGEKNDVQERILQNVKENIGQIRNRYKSHRLVIELGKIAAIIFLFSITAFYGFQFMRDAESNRMEEMTSNLQPGKDKALIKFYDGTVLSLEELSVGEAFENSDFTVKKTKKGNLEYCYNKILDNKPSENEWNTLITPSGGKIQIVLADGTKVWLNAESTLTFPKNFWENTRMVKVTGEVYFEVSPDSTKPFIVNTKEMDIKVLGTSFNVSTYEDNPYHMVSLIEGAVQVETSLSISNLIPGQRASIENNQINVSTFDLESELAWTNDYFLFKNKNIKEIMNVLARWYNAEVEYNGENWADKNYTLQISRKENIGEILSIIELTESIKFKVTGRRIVVVT